MTISFYDVAKRKRDEIMKKLKEKAEKHN